VSNSLYMKDVRRKSRTNSFVNLRRPARSEYERLSFCCFSCEGRPKTESRRIRRDSVLETLRNESHGMTFQRRAILRPHCKKKTPHQAGSDGSRLRATGAVGRGFDRGRENRQCRFPLPPNRTGGSPASGSPVSGVYIEAGWRGQGLLAWCKAQAAQSMSWASADGRCRVRGLSSCVVSSVCFAGAFGPSRLWP